MRLLVDENFNNDIARALLRIEPNLDILRVQDTLMYQKAVPLVLQWAPQENRILLTQPELWINRGKDKCLVQAEGRFLGLKAISDQASDEMHHEADRATVAGMFNLRNILELVDDGFNNGPFAQQQLVAQQ